MGNSLMRHLVGFPFRLSPWLNAIISIASGHHPDSSLSITPSLLALGISWSICYGFGLMRRREAEWKRVLELRWNLKVSFLRRNLKLWMRPCGFLCSRNYSSVDELSRQAGIWEIIKHLLIMLKYLNLKIIRRKLSISAAPEKFSFESLFV